MAKIADRAGADDPPTSTIRRRHARDVEVTTKVELCKADQVAAGTALRVEAAGLTVAVFNVDGEFYVTDDACTHGPGSLSEGFIEEDVVECNFHNGQFNIKTGAIVSPPCSIPVKTYHTSVDRV